MRRRFLPKVILSLCSFLITLLAVEVSLRIYGYNSLRNWQNGRELILRPSQHPDLKYELTPGASGWAWGTNIKINSQGFRGPEPAAESYANTRIIVLGDSITFGHFLSEEKTFSHQLQQRLLAADEHYEVMNFGVGGYDSLQEVTLLETRGLKFHPRLVVVAYCLNDISIASASLDYIKRLQSQQNSFLYKFRLAQLISNGVGRLQDQSWANYVNRPEVFHRQYEGQIDAISDQEAELLQLMASAPKGLPFAWYSERDRVGRLRFAFRRLGNMAKENGFSVVVMIIPWLIPEEGRNPQSIVHRIVETEAHRAGFDTIDITSEFMGYGIEHLKITPDDPIHPNEAGHAIIADSLANYIQKQSKKRAKK
jgi:lysophospholipase L1-like esterase